MSLTGLPGLHDRDMGAMHHGRTEKNVRQQPDPTRVAQGGTTVSGTTPAESTSPRNPIPMTSTWFHRFGMRPYELLQPLATEPSPQPLRILPAHTLAA